MKYTGNMDDFEVFASEIEKAIESGIMFEDGEATGFDVDKARESVIDMLEKWKLIVFCDEN